MSDAQPSPQRFEYFMLRLHRPAARPEAAGADGLPLAGTVERLGTGDKRTFADAVELTRLMDDWMR
jgi:hypothetical protein